MSARESRLRVSVERKLREEDSFLSSEFSSGSLSSRARHRVGAKLPALHPENPIGATPRTLRKSLSRLGLGVEAVAAYMPVPLKHVGAKAKVRPHVKKQYQEAILSMQQEQDIKNAFQAFDRDGSGSIGAKELRKAMFSLGSHPTKEQVQWMIQDVDDDDSGTVDELEFRQFMMDAMVRRCEAKVKVPDSAQSDLAVGDIVGIRVEPDDPDDDVTFEEATVCLVRPGVRTLTNTLKATDIDSCPTRPYPVFGPPASFAYLHMCCLIGLLATCLACHVLPPWYMCSPHRPPGSSKRLLSGPGMKYSSASTRAAPNGSVPACLPACLPPCLSARLPPCLSTRGVTLISVPHKEQHNLGMYGRRLIWNSHTCLLRTRMHDGELRS